MRQIPTREILVSHRWFSGRGYFEAGEIYKEEKYSGEEYEVRDDFYKFLYNAENSTDRGGEPDA